MHVKRKKSLTALPLSPLTFFQLIIEKYCHLQAFDLIFLQKTANIICNFIDENSSRQPWTRKENFVSHVQMKAGTTCLVQQATIASEMFDLSCSHLILPLWWEAESVRRHYLHKRGEFRRHHRTHLSRSLSVELLFVLWCWLLRWQSFQCNIIYAGKLLWTYLQWHREPERKGARLSGGRWFEDNGLDNFPAVFLVTCIQISQCVKIELDAS